MIWILEFYPQEGKRNSPVDIIANLPNVNDQQLILDKLDLMIELDFNEWPKTWTHKIVDKIYQITIGNHRLLYYLTGKTIVILHVCRKKGRKIHRKDKRRALIHYREHISGEG